MLSRGRGLDLQGPAHIDGDALNEFVRRAAVESLVDFVVRYAANGDEVAVRYRRGYRMETWTYARIALEANRVARELEFRNIRKGDAVLLWGENSPEWIISFFGCLLRGAVAVPIDPGSTARICVSRRTGSQRQVSSFAAGQLRTLSCRRVPSSWNRFRSSLRSVTLRRTPPLLFRLRTRWRLSSLREQRRSLRRRDFSRQCPCQHRAY